MSTSSSVYEPEQDDESSESDAAEPLKQRYAPEPFSPALQNLTLSSRRGSPASKPPRNRQTSHWQKEAPKGRNNVLRNTRWLPVDRYLGLYNETVKDTLDPTTADDGHDFSLSSQHGVVTWSAQEKNTFFSALSRRGKDAVPQIAALVGTKSEMEVQDYLRLLHRSFEHHETTGRNLKPVRLLNIPAALEIGHDCNEFLDKVAYASSLRDEQADNVAGRRQHKDMWLIDREVAAYVEEQLEPEEHDYTKTNNDIFATARLLNIPKWVELSENVFMNPGKRRPDDNWTDLCFADETPALTCDAFSDFYTLIVSLTRRLVQSSIFFAASRIRALKPGGWDTKGLVHPSDVNTALSVLNMKANDFEFWRTAPRRCALDIRSRKNRYVGLISYDEVEERLSRSVKGNDISRSSSVSKSAPPSDDEENNDADTNAAVHEEAASADLDSADAASSDGHSGPSEDELSDPEENYASKLDRNVSRESENQIWKRLGRDPPSLFVDGNRDPGPAPEIKAESDDERPLHRPVAKRKAKEDLADWRDRTLYQSEWESRMEMEETQHRDKRQRVQYGEGFED